MPNLTIQSGSNQDGLRVTVIDEVSRTVLAEFKLTPGEVFELVKGGVVNVEGKIGNDLDRVGKLMLNDSVEVPRAITDPLTMNQEARLMTGTDWARAGHPGWDTYSPRFTNRGTVIVTMRKWIDNPAAEDARNAAAGLYGSVEG